MKQASSNHGFALVSVLWLIALLTGITAAYHAQARMEARLMTTELQREQAESLAEAGLWIALRDHYAAVTFPTADAAGRVTRVIDVEDTAVSVTIADASGMINLNNAPQELLAAMLAAETKLSAEEQSMAVDAILDWRDGDSVSRVAGAEDADYALANASHGAKDALFATVEELQLVRGITAEVYRQIARVVTVFGNHSRINVAAAPLRVLSVLPRDTATTGGYDQRFVQQTGEDIYTATADATVGTATAHVSATVRYARSEARPIQVLAWSDVPAAIETPATPHDH